jgi:hypothetical protein
MENTVRITPVLVILDQASLGERFVDDNTVDTSVLASQGSHRLKKRMSMNETQN